MNIYIYDRESSSLFGDSLNFLPVLKCLEFLLDFKNFFGKVGNSVFFYLDLDF